MKPPSTERLTRDQADRIASALFTAAFAEAEAEDPSSISKRAFAAHVDQSEQLVKRQLAGEKPPQLRLLLGALSGPFAPIGERVLRQLAARIGKVLADEPKVSDVLNDYRTFASLGAHAGEVLRELGTALDDGVITRAEAKTLDTALEALGEAVASLRARLREPLKNGADGVRGGKPRLV